jgi:tetratricopeptide (TPR) repeat protein
MNKPFLKIILLQLLLALTFACSKDQKKSEVVQMTQQQRLLVRIDSLSKLCQIDFDRNPGALNLELHQDLVKNLEEYGYTFIDTLAPKYLVKAARMHEEIFKDKQRAVKLYGEIYNLFPDFPDRPMMVFYQGNAYHDLNDTTKAINIFQFFIKNYPDHPFADDAEGMINLIRMTEEERNKLFGGDIPS